MTVVLLIAGLLVFFIGVSHCLCKPSAQELEQAALLPFADDPAAAQAMHEATGRQCERVLAPVAEASPAPAAYRLDA